jgi:ribosomal protein S18 acetylase RimI-like enzyme
VFVQCHGDGSLGALHTQPAYRRRGLAKVVLAAHLAKYEARGVPGYCYIEEHNTASMALFESLGWARLPWVVYWVFEKSVQDSG